MAQSINLFENETQSNTSRSEQYEYQCTDITPKISTTESTLHLMYPGRMLFSIKETATILNVSYEFVRSRTIRQAIPTVDMGNRRMVSINTINLLINNGI